MYLSPNLFSSVVLLKLIFVGAQNMDSAVYFPTEDAYQERSPVFNVQKNGPFQAISRQDLGDLKGTGIYEKYVDDIISKGIYKLAIEINKLLETQVKGGENVLFSPLSITSALALVLLGSNGATFNQLSEFLGLHTGIPDIDKKSQVVHEEFSRVLNRLNQTSGFQMGQEVKVALAVFVQEDYQIRPIYRSIAEDLYNSNILNVNFERHPQEAQKLINNWVSERTNGKIRNILGAAPSTDTKVILTSALYFNAEWERHFFAKSTRRRPFYINGRNSQTNIEAELMANGGEFPYYKDPALECEILGLPYKGNKSTMYIIMPFDSSREKLHQFESKITEADLNRLVSKTKLTGTVVLFPKMKLETTIDLKETLKSLGVTSLFDPKQANLALLSPGLATPRTNVLVSRVANQSDLNLNSGNNIKINANIPLEPATPSVKPRIGSTQSIDNIRQLINEQSSDNSYQNPGLYADQVLHKVYMDITEKGTEAAAATSVSLSRDGSRVSFRVDVPFCFFIRHEETNTILFWGSVVMPTPHYQLFQ